jgi:hypothetical protein
MFTQDNLASKSGPELVAIFNGLEGTSPVKRFTNREVGIRRILAVTADYPVEEATITPAEALENLDTQLEEDEANLAAEVAVARQPKVRGIYNEPRKDLIRTFRPNSRRGRLITLLLNEGATFDELLANTEVGFNEEDVLHKTIRILNWWTGYGLTTDDSGVIRLTD